MLLRLVLPCGWAILMAWAAFAAAAPMTIAAVDRGMLVEQIGRAILTEAYGRLHVPVIFRERPAARALAESAEGLTDGELQRVGGLSSSYPDLVQVKVPVNYFDIVVLTRTAQFVPAGWNSLRPYTIGFHRGIVVFEQGTRGMKIDMAASNELVLRKLIGGRTDIALMPDIEARQLLATMPGHGIVTLQPSLERVQLFHYLHKQHVALVPRLEQVLAAMQADGSIVAIRTRLLAAAGQF